jgi:hypothetical protein
MAMRLSELCEMIDLPAGMTERVLACDVGLDYSAIDTVTDRLQARDTWDQAVKDMQAILSDDPAGVKLLTCMLRCTLQSHQAYLERGISEKVFVDTMKFFTRFVNEHTEVYGSPAFTLGWWAPRQISLNEFRIGSLEYETV